jgi:hypothetical protein
LLGLEVLGLDHGVLGQQMAAQPNADG